MNEQNKQLNEILGTDGVDFFIPENFVKLLECYVNIPFVGVRFITGLIKADVDDEDLEEMKHQAQQVEWKR